MRCFKAWLAALCMLLCGGAQAHKSSDAYVHLSGGSSSKVDVRVDVALRDLDVALDLDSNGDSLLTWGEVRAAWPAIETYVRANFQLEGCALPAATRSLERRIDGVYAALQWQTDCQPASTPSIRYSMLAAFDPTHRGIARIDWAGAPSTLRVLVPQLSQAPVPPTGPTASPSVDLFERATTETAAAARPATAPLQFVNEGVRHILTGYDHMLFLICLLLPSVMHRTATGWRPVDRLSQAVWPVAGIVTAFTVAHSITLALASTGALSLSPAFIEPAIAGTIVLAAFDNLRQIFGSRRAIVTFVFGLIHGFGFAGVLAELNLPPGQLAWALLQFNLGLEAGQLLVVVGVTALLYSLRRAVHYPRWVIRGGSFAAMTLAGLWLVERVPQLSSLTRWG